MVDEVFMELVRAIRKYNKVRFSTCWLCHAVIERNVLLTPRRGQHTRSRTRQVELHRTQRVVSRSATASATLALTERNGKMIRMVVDAAVDARSSDFWHPFSLLTLRPPPSHT